ncbi:MAG TPA: class I SAM-dependent methyltransferase, partial [Anaerolineae bacterium]|nr:class I SAM-dependent methyltransferase [Anaerolineae bacterium]
LVYSCGYFPTGKEDLDTAQELKMDYICRKLQLKPGERLLDIGCGWGGLVIWAAKHYSVETLGITLSKEQYTLAQKRIKDAGLADRCHVELLDYREVSPAPPFDKLVSVGMFEHVGEDLLPTYFHKAWDLLRPGGLFLNHGIARQGEERKRPFWAQDTFTNRYVFPDGELVPISTTLTHLEKAGFEVRDVESLREHYALTLRHWVDRLEERREEACRFVDDVTYRVWRLFMSTSSYGFATGRLNVYQVLASKNGPGGASGLPMSRAGWYRR